MDKNRNKHRSVFCGGMFGAAASSPIYGGFAGQIWIMGITIAGQNFGGIVMTPVTSIIVESIG
eukprot:TRINITY_DN17130_c0_g1_i1.p1 TRINITY_DN17130_c0_g1~~TRINITY_DN17130_c0_g1_i1.p1  ORF type:complete len:63 (-),score=12.10 TRINITY_DN17130_c0_g1_i1:222-410(-)